MLFPVSTQSVSMGQTECEISPLVSYFGEVSVIVCVLPYGIVSYCMLVSCHMLLCPAVCHSVLPCYCILLYVIVSYLLCVIMSYCMLCVVIMSLCPIVLCVVMSYRILCWLAVG